MKHLLILDSFPAHNIITSHEMNKTTLVQLFRWRRFSYRWNKILYSINTPPSSWAATVLYSNPLWTRDIAGGRHPAPCHQGNTLSCFNYLFRYEENKTNHDLKIKDVHLQYLRCDQPSSLINLKSQLLLKTPLLCKLLISSSNVSPELTSRQPCKDNAGI